MSPALLLARLAAAAAALLLLLQQPHAAAQQQPVWLDSSLTFEQRAQALVGALTLDEKLTQLNSRTAAVPRLGVSAQRRSRMCGTCQPCVLCKPCPPTCAQRAAAQHPLTPPHSHCCFPSIARWQIPAFDYWTGCAHGVADYYWSTGGTMFSMPLGLAATFDTQLMQEVGFLGVCVCGR